VGPRAGLDTVAKRKKIRHCPCRESNLGRPAGSVVKIQNGYVPNTSLETTITPTCLIIVTGTSMEEILQEVGTIKMDLT